MYLGFRNNSGKVFREMIIMDEKTEKIYDKHYHIDLVDFCLFELICPNFSFLFF